MSRLIQRRCIGSATVFFRRPASLQVRELPEQILVRRREKNEPETFLLNCFIAATTLSMRNANGLNLAKTTLPAKRRALRVGTVAETVSAECQSETLKLGCFVRGHIVGLQPPLPIIGGRK